MSTVDLNSPVELQEREVVGKQVAMLRHDGMVPAVIHNHGQASLHVMGPQLQLEKIYEAAAKHHPLQIKAGNQEFLALIKDAHYHPVKRRLDHLVFQAIRRDEKVEAEVPIHIEGEIPAEKIGLQILHQLDHVEVEALPQDLPDEIVVQGSQLAELHDKITVADLPIPSGVTVLTEPDHPIASVIETKAMISEEELAAQEAEAEAQAAEAAGEADVEAGGEGDTGNAPEGSEKEATGAEAPKE